MYRHFPWTLKAAYNPADFYDFFGPTKTSRKGYGCPGSSGSDYLISDRPRFLEYTVNAAYYGGLERLPYNQNVLATFDSYTAATASLDYKRTAELHWCGRRGEGSALVARDWRATYVNTRLLHQGHRASSTSASSRPSTIRRSGCRGAAGYSRGDRDDSFASFYFGGFGNNYVDHHEVKRYRDYERFPGAEIDEIAGTNFARLMIGVDASARALPPRRLPAAVLHVRARGAVRHRHRSPISTTLSFRREAGNVGGQVDFRLVIFSALESTLSVGYAAFKEDGHAMDTEFMISLKIM